MNLTASIWDNTTGDPIPGASVFVVDAAGNRATGTAAAGDGSFTLNSPVLDTAGAQLSISSVGYQAVLIAPYLLQEQGGVGLDQSTEDLAPAMVVAHQKPPSSWIWIAAGALALIIFLGSRKSRVGKIDLPKVDWLKIALYVGIPLGAYFLIIRPILINLGILTEKSTSPQAEANQTALDQSIQQAKDSGGSAAQLSYSPTQYTSWANDIYTQGISSNPDQSTIVNDVVQVNTMMDLLQLKSAFGTRKASNAFWSTCNFLNFNCPEYDLDSFLKAVLDTEHLNNVNMYLSQQGINYTFQ